MKILITGALGHIGSFLIRELPNQFPGAEIIMIDNMMTQRFPSLLNLSSTGNYRSINIDSTTKDLSSLVDDVNYFIHLAATLLMLLEVFKK